MISKEMFIQMCETFKENLSLYQEVDNMIECSTKTREYFKRAVKPIMKIAVIDIIGQDVLSIKIAEDDWGDVQVYDTVMNAIKDYFANQARVVEVLSADTISGKCHKAFDEVYTAEVLYNWMSKMDAETPSTWKLPKGMLSSGYTVINNYSH